MLKIENVYKTFNKGTINEKVALKGLNLEMEEGDFITVIGGNGAGKSTMLNMVAGVYPVDEGRIAIDGQDVTGDRITSARSIWTCVPGSDAWYRGRHGTAGKPCACIQKRKTIWLKMGTSCEGKSHLQRKACDARTWSGRPPVYKSRPSVRRAASGDRAFDGDITSARVLLLDEHTAALDVKTAAKVLELTNEIVGENNLTTLMVTHNMRDAIRMGNRLVMMNDGRIIYDVRGEEKEKLEVSDLLQKFKERLANGETLDDILAGGFCHGQ